MLHVKCARAHRACSNAARQVRTCAPGVYGATQAKPKNLRTKNLTTKNPPYRPPGANASPRAPPPPRHARREHVDERAGAAVEAEDVAAAAAVVAAAHVDVLVGADGEVEGVEAGAGDDGAGRGAAVEGGGA